MTTVCVGVGTNSHFCLPLTVTDTPHAFWRSRHALLPEHQPILFLRTTGALHQQQRGVGSSSSLFVKVIYEFAILHVIVLWFRRRRYLHNGTRPDTEPHVDGEPFL